MHLRSHGQWPLVLVAAALACNEPGPPAVPERTAAIELGIGRMEGDGADVFGRIAGIALHPSGRIFILDGQAEEVRVFAPDGAFLYAFGRNGQGPGEFSGACCIAFDPQNRLWVRDGGNARYDVFDVGAADARFAYTVRMAHSDANFWAPITFDAAGRLIDIGHRTRADAFDIAHLHLDSAGAVVDSTYIASVPPDSLGVKIVERDYGRRFFYPPFGPRELIAHGPGGVHARAISSSYRITWFDARGNVLRVIERAGVQGPVLDDEDRAAAQERMDRDGQFGLSAADRFPIPERRPPLSQLSFDQSGNLWVHHSVARAQSRRADVYDANGLLLHALTWPGDVDLGFHAVLTDSMAIGIRRDSLGVESVVRLRWVARLKD